MFSLPLLFVCLLPLPGTSSVATATVSEDVILIPDEATVIHLEPESSRLPSLLPSFRSARAGVRLDARTSVDTRFDRDGENIVELGIGGRLELEVEVTEWFSAYSAPNFFYVSAFDDEGGDRQVVYLPTPETRLSVTAGHFDIRVGALVFNWGASELIGPVDMLNPLDYRRNFVAAIDDAKLPVLAAEVAGHFGPLTVRAVVEPFFTAPRFFLTGWDTALIQSQLTQRFDVPNLERFLGEETLDDAGDKLVITERPKDRIDDATLALRTTLTLDDFEVSATAIHGWEPLPEIQVNPDLVVIGGRLAEAVANRLPVETDPELFAALGRLQDALERGETAFRGRYRRRDVLGFDATYAIDPFILKVDVAYAFSRLAYTQDYLPVHHPWLTTVAGFEFFSGDSLQMIVEAFALTVIGLRSNYRLLLFEPDAPPPSTTDEGRRTITIPGVAGIVRYGVLGNDLLFELASVSTFTRGDILLMPAVRYRPAESHQLSLHGTWVEGRRDGYGGVYSHNDQISFSYQWTH